EACSGPRGGGRSAPPQRRYQAIASALTPAGAAARPRLGTTGRAARAPQRAARASAIRSGSRAPLSRQAVRPTDRPVTCQLARRAAALSRFTEPPYSRPVTAPP